MTIYCLKKICQKELTTDPTNWTSRLGEHNHYKDESRQVDHKIESIILNHSKSEDSMVIDIALMKLVEPAMIIYYLFVDNELLVYLNIF